MDTLSISLFGQFEARLNNKIIPGFRTRKVQALLIYLVREPAPQRRESLMELLWPGMPDRSARKNLRQVVYNLRQGIPDLSAKEGDADTAVPLLLTNRQTIQLNPQAAVTSDVDQFAALLQQVQTHSHVDLLTCQRCRQDLETAVSLYRADFLTDFYLDDSNPFESWAEAERQTLRRQALDALETLTIIYTRQKDFPQARTYARRQLEIDDLREGAYRQLMEILALDGQREAALAQYEHCRHLLHEELGMEPTSRTTAIFDKIVAGDLRFDEPQAQGVRGYELKDEIGEGAYGTIYRAVQPTIGRDVAVKVIRRKYANDPQFIRRFEAEAQTIARLEHPYIVPLYDYWRDPEGAFLVMRLFRGGNLLDSLAGGPWGLEPTCQLVDQIASALAAAHHLGIIHRDIKPANILFDEAGNAYLSDFGIAKNLFGDWQLTGEGDLVGTPDYVSPEQLRNEPVSPQSDLYSLGAVLYETLTGERPFSDAPFAIRIQKHLQEPLPLVSATRPGLPVQIDEVIQRATAKRPSKRYPDALAMAEAFRQAVRGEMTTAITIPTAVPAVTELYNPYKGLQAFQEADADDFYGRELLVEQLVGHLADSRFLAVVGPSGSGKSSVVKAGLIPALRQAAIPGSDNWFVAEMVPGDHPLEELELALLPIAVNPPPDLVEPMQKDERGMLRTIRRILPDAEDAQLLLVIDQFEELFTLVDDDSRRQYFLDSLLAALNAPRSPLHVIVTLRADFYDRPLQIQPIADLFKRHTEIILPLTQEELTWAIQEPARRVGVSLESGATTAMLTDVTDQPGALPLLQYALTELFEERQDNVMTLAAYQALGGVSGALAQRAEELYAGFDEANQETIRQLFLRLVTLGEGVEDTRRRVRLSELETLSLTREPNTANRTPITEYGRYRLLTFDHDPLTREPTVEVAHEALLREWPRLRRWLQESRDDVRLQRSLAAFAAEWAQNDLDAGFLLRGSRLDLFAGWAAGMDLALTPEEQAFLAASVTAREQREAEERARQQRELETARQLAETERQATQGLRRRAYYLVGALVVAVILAGVAIIAGRQSSLNAQTAQANANLAATSEAEAVTEADQRATAQAVAEVESQRADEERDAAVSAEETAVAEGIRADEQRNAALAAEVEANEARQVAEEQAKIAFSRELAAAAVANLDKDPERSALLALYAVREAYTQEAEEVLHLAVPHLRVLQRMVGEEDFFIKTMDYNPDGSRLVTAGDGSTIQVWDTTNGQELLRWEGHEEFNKNVLYSNDGAFIVTTGGNDGTGKVWNATTGELLHTLNGHNDNPNLVEPDEPNWVNGLAISPDDKIIATGASDGKAILWDAATGTQLKTITIPDEKVLAIDHIEFSPDGSWLAMWGWTWNLQENIIQIVDVVSGAEIALLQETEEDFIGFFTFHPDGKMLLINDGGEDRAVRLWDIESGTEVARYSIGENGRAVFSPDGSLFVDSDNGGAARIYETDTGNEVLELIGHQGLVSGYHFSPDGTKLATVSWDQTVRIWDLGPAHEILTLQPFNDAWHSGVAQAAFSPDGSMLALGGYAGDISIWDPSSGENILTLAGQEEYIGGLFFSPDGSRLASGSDDSTINIWDTTSGELLLTMLGHEDDVNNLAYSPDGVTIASVGLRGDLAFVWDAATGEILHELPLKSSSWGVAYSPDSALIAIGENDEIVSIWDAATGQLVQEINLDNEAGADDVHFSPDGKNLIAAGYDGFVTIWDLETGSLVQSFKAHEGYPVGSAIHPNGEIFATVSGDSTARLWNVQSGERLLTLEGASQGLGDAEFSPDGTRLVTSGGGGKVRIYTLSLDELVAVAESRLSRSLTEAECQEYLHMEACPVDE